MKNYTKIPFTRISDIESYVEEKLKEGYCIIELIVNENRQEIDELTSYANDSECKSYYRNLADSDEQLRSSVITECLTPYYAFKDRSRDGSTDDIDIENDSQDIITFTHFKRKFIAMEKKYYSGEPYGGDDGDTEHFEFYISNERADIANFGGSMEIDFVTEWMTEQGYYSKQM